MMVITHHLLFCAKYLLKRDKGAKCPRILCKDACDEVIKCTFNAVAYKENSKDWMKNRLDCNTN